LDVLLTAKISLVTEKLSQKTTEGYSLCPTSSIQCRQQY